MIWEGLNPPYSTIVADPPWRYQTSGATTTAKHGSGAEDHYSTMSNDEIAALPVADLAAANAHLYLWTTNPRIFGERSKWRSEASAADIMDAWGFRYITLLTWVKTGALGMGFYFRGDTEHILFGVRGDLPIPAEKRQRNVFTAKKGRHSAKPAAFYDLVESVSPGPYVDLFSRAPRFGWDSWGKGYE